MAYHKRAGSNLIANNGAWWNDGGTTLKKAKSLSVLCWHNVAATPYFGGAGRDGPAGLRRQLTFLKRFSNVVGFPEAVDRLAGDGQLPMRAVAITFDDGYRDNLELAVPLLEELGLPATFFLCPELLGSRVPPWWERLAWAMINTRVKQTFRWRDLLVTPPGLKRGDSVGMVSEMLKAMDERDREAAMTELLELLDPVGGEPTTPIMDWDDARELARRGFTVGSHSQKHAILANETAEDQDFDLSQSRKELEVRTGARVDLLAYPNGTSRDFDERTVGAAVKAGYRGAATTIPGWNNAQTPAMELRRFVVNPESGVGAFAVLLNHLLRPLRQHA